MFPNVLSNVVSVYLYNSPGTLHAGDPNITGDNIRFRMINAANNGAQPAGTVLSVVGFLGYYSPPTATPPIITAVLFNGVNVCSSPNNLT